MVLGREVHAIIEFLDSDIWLYHLKDWVLSYGDYVMADSPHYLKFILEPSK
jgi:hypothetical protein